MPLKRLSKDLKKDRDGGAVGLIAEILDLVLATLLPDWLYPRWYNASHEQRRDRVGCFLMVCLLLALGGAIAWCSEAGMRR